MSSHLFVFKSGFWLGEGKIILSMLEEELKFFTKWSVQEADFANKIGATQDIQIAGISDKMRNELVFLDVTSNAFSVKMDNLNVGSVVGTGIFDEKKIAWEFRNNSLNFEGFEIYTLIKEGEYALHAEYVTADQFRTQIDGRIWQSSEQLNMDEEES